MSPLLMVALLLGGIFAFFVLLGLFTPGNGADLLDWDPAAKAEDHTEAQLDDLDELRALNHAHRAARGLGDPAADANPLAEDELLRGR